MLVAQRNVPSLSDAGRQWYYRHRYGILETGAYLNALAPTLYWWSRGGSARPCVQRGVRACIARMHAQGHARCDPVELSNIDHLMTLWGKLRLSS